MRADARAALLALGLAAAAPVRAHDFWIESTPGPEATWFHLCVGEGLAGDERPLQEARIVRAEWHQAGGTTSLVPPPRLAILPPPLPRGARDGVIVYATRPLPIALEAGRFEPYVAEEGQDAVLRLRRERGEERKPGRERYSRAAKALVGGADASLATRRYALRLEVVPAADPRAAAPGAVLEATVWWQDRPLAGATVRLLRRAPGAGEGEVVAEERSAADGRVWLSLAGPGQYLVKTMHMVRLGGDPAADWESVWGSLSFAIADPAARRDVR